MKVRINPCSCYHGHGHVLVIGLFLSLLTLGVSALDKQTSFQNQFDLKDPIDNDPDPVIHTNITIIITHPQVNQNQTCQNSPNCNAANRRRRQGFADVDTDAPNMYLGFADPHPAQAQSQYQSQWANPVSSQSDNHVVQTDGHAAHSVQPDYTHVESEHNAISHYSQSQIPNYVHEYFEQSGAVNFVEPHQEIVPYREVSVVENLVEHEPSSPLHLPGGGVLTTFAIAYLLLGVFLLKDKSLSGGHQAGKCDDHGFPPTLQYISAVPDPIAESPHAGSNMQKKMLDMFYGEHDDSSEFRVPDMSHIGQMCSPNAFFYGMNPRHMMAVEAVKTMFMEQRSVKEVESMAKALRHSPDLHPTVWYEALMKSVHERGDMAGMVMPGPIDAIPDSFIPAESMYGALGARSGARSGRVVRGRKGHKKGKPKCARVDGRVGRDNGIENRLWYWREDLQLNSHHWYWHMEHPLMAKTHPDRRGELFYYLHHGFLARYNIERMCNGLERIGPMPTHPGTHIHPPYNAHLDDTNTGRSWTDRPPHTPLSDIDHSRNKEMPQQVMLGDWADHGHRIGTDISQGVLRTRKGQRGLLPSMYGIDIVGNTLEATDLSINPDYYGMIGYHNEGHVILSLAVDPNFHHGLPPGPMGDTATSLRDPIFYPWHTNIDNLFDSYKGSLAPYQPYGGDYPLVWSGVHVSEIGITAYGGKQNAVKTFWNERKFELGVGLAFGRNESNSHGDHSFPVCAKHLDHEEFVYHFEIERTACAKTHTGAATVRVFIAPRYDEHGHKLWFSEQRRLFVPLDSFTVNLKVGKNVVTRNSEDSTLTIPWRKTLQQLQEEFRADPEPSCGCGWPHHLLLPKGSPKGKEFDMFVMVTNGDEDFVMDKDAGHGPDGHGHVMAQKQMCRAAHIYCGIQNKMYPDGKPMGYPFDRHPFKVPLSHTIWNKVANLVGHGYRPVSSIEEFVQAIPNAALAQIKIIHDEGHR